MTAPPLPDGITDRHATPKRLHAYASLLSLLVLGALLATAMTGWLAGDRTTPRRVEAPAATLTASIPDRLRNGEFFEMRLVVTARTDMNDATVAVSPALWRDMTINSMVPAATDEEFKDGAFRFRYGPLKAGDTLEVKIDGQINPPLTVGTGGEVALYDGDMRVAALPVRIRVLP
ncbi:hypothetical protein [uncultured Sphingomonas sp.]|uniref:hypothetical protein n=1 Tax=uncultured Sphingomonas sp. TaxID=158754 RepID=UPI0025D142F9|nr:hypothetical protein [uncultured Sphingomonas sp.]